jgi:hypothetical protein
MEEGNKGVESRVDKEIREAEIETEGSIEMGRPKRHAEEEYLHKESLESGVDKEREEVEIEIEESMEMGRPEGHAKGEYLHEESILETDASESDIDNEASV